MPVKGRPGRRDWMLASWKASGHAASVLHAGWNPDGWTRFRGKSAFYPAILDVVTPFVFSCAINIGPTEKPPALALSVNARR